MALDFQDENKIKEIIREELLTLIKSDRYTFEKTIQILNGRNIEIGGVDGTKIGHLSLSKIGFWGATPVDQPASVSDPSNAGTLYSQTQAQSVVDAVKAIISRLEEAGIIAP